MSKTADKKKLTHLLATAAAVLIALLLIAVLGLSLKSSLEANGDLQDKVAELEQKLIDANKIDVTYVGNKLETISELATAKMTYNGIIHFSEGDIPLINKKEFYLYYRASIKAYFDLSQAVISVTDQAVTIELPPAELDEPVIDETSFQFFDYSASLLNREEMMDLVESISAAKEDVLAQPETQNMKETAETQVKALITGLFAGEIGDRELIIRIG